MAQDPRDSRDPRPPQYPPHEYPGYGSHNAQHSPPQRQDNSREEHHNGYPPPPDPARHGQYAPAPGPYPPPQQWAGHTPGTYPPPPTHSYDTNHSPYHYAPPAGQPSQPVQPDPFRLPPPPFHHGYYPPHPFQPPPAPAPRQRTAIACKYCRKRKIRCSGYDSSPDGRCQNCVRFNQQCLFHPVSSQAAFVPASAVYGPNARGPMGGQGDGQGANGQAHQPMLYGAHGQPLGPLGSDGQPQYGYPPHSAPHAYPPPHQPHAYSPMTQYPPPPAGHGGPSYQHGPPPPVGHGGPPYEHAGQPPQPRPSDQSDRASLKRGRSDDSEDPPVQSPHPNARPRNSAYGGNNYDYNSHGAPTSPATSTMSYQSYPPAGTSAYTNGNHTVRGNNSPPATAGLTPSSAHSLNSPRPAGYDGKTPPPTQPGSAGSSQNGQNGRNGMKVHEMLGNPNSHGPPPEQRGKNDNDMLSKLDGKKKPE